MKRTTHRSKAGAKLYAKRDKAGRITDVQTYKRAHRRDLATTSVAERTVKAWITVDAGGKPISETETGICVGRNRADCRRFTLPDYGERIIRCTITLHEPRARK